MFRVLCFCVCVFVSSCVCDFLSVSGDGDSPRLSQRPARPTRDNITLYTNTVASGMGYGALARVYWEVRGYSGACRGAKASAKILSFAAKIAKSKVPTQEKKKVQNKVSSLSVEKSGQGQEAKPSHSIRSRDEKRPCQALPWSHRPLPKTSTLPTSKSHAANAMVGSA